MKRTLGQNTALPITTSEWETLKGPPTTTQSTEHGVASSTQPGIGAAPVAPSAPHVTRASIKNSTATEEVNTDGFSAAQLRSTRGLGYDIHSKTHLLVTENNARPCISLVRRAAQTIRASGRRKDNRSKTLTPIGRRILFSGTHVGSDNQQR